MPDRIPVSAIIKAITDDITRKLAHNDTMSNNGVVYTGVSYEWHFRGEFQSRRDQSLDTTVRGNISFDEPQGDISTEVEAKGQQVTAGFKKKK